MEPVLGVLKELPAKSLPLSTARALNKTAQTTKSVATKAIAKDIGIAQKEVRPLLLVQKASQRQCTAVLHIVSKKRFSLIKIDAHARQVPSGVSYRGQARQRQLIAGAFIATMKNGHRGVYARKPGAARLPIRELMGPSAAHVFRQPRLQSMMKETIETRWPPLFEHELEWELQRLQAK